MRQTALESIFELANNNDKVIFIGSDLGPDVLKNFKAKFPERFFMEGAAEQHIISMAAGMALEGFIPYVNTISTFLTRRCYEQIYIDCGLQNLKVRLIGNGGGVVYSPLGSTHTAIDDINLLRAIPNMTIIAPADSLEMKRVMKSTIDYKGPIYIRIAKGNEKIVTNDFIKNFKIGNIYSLDKKNEKNVIFTTGITLDIALQIKKRLIEKGIKINIHHMPTLKPLNYLQLFKILTNCQNVFSIEEHSIVGGLGTILSEFIAENNKIKIKNFKRFGFPDQPLKGYGRQHEMMDKYNLNAKSIFKNIIKILKR